MTHAEVEEGEIVQAYVRGRLAGEQRHAFEEHFFACDQCFEQVRMSGRFVAGVRAAAEAGQLDAAAEQPTVPFGPRWLRPAFALSAMALVALAAATAWLVSIELPRARTELQAHRQQLENERREREGLEQKLALNRPPVPQGNLPLVMLEASRAQSANALWIPDGASHLAVWIDLGPDAGSEPFRLEIRSTANEPVETVEGLVKNRYNALAAILPADRLPAGVYVARLVNRQGSLVSEYRLEIRR